MAAFLVRGCMKQRSRKLLGDILKLDLCATTRTPACSEICILFHDYHTTSVYLRKRKVAEEKENEVPNKFELKKKLKSPVYDIWPDITVAELAKVAGRPVSDIIEALSYSDPEVYHPNTAIENRAVLYETVRKLGARFKVVARKTQKNERKDEDVVRRNEFTNALSDYSPPPDPSVLIKRHPVVTVMGHVDHGKTTLLDSLRNTSVVAAEFGGITQHIGAFNVKLPSGEMMTFLDTPGHAAFAAMRARGANATDIVVLVVAADDGVMEQTIQSINMAKDANVPIIVAINKIDKHTANIERTKKMLAEQGIQVEDLGGDVQSVSISALQGTNLQLLVETIATQAELMELKGDPKGLVEGVVIEASVDPHRGKVATVLVQRGTLRKGSVLVSGLAWAKVRSMFNHAGEPVSEAGLSAACQIVGWRELPDAGDEFLEVENEQKANKVMRIRSAKKAEQDLVEQATVVTQKMEAHNAVYKEELKKRQSTKYYRRKYEPRKKQFHDDDPTPKLNIVLKGDVTGSVEAILDVFDSYGDEDRCRLNVVHYGVGQLTKSEAEIAKAFDAVVYCFNVGVSKDAGAMLDKEDIRLHNVIYKLVDDVKEEISKKLPPGTAEEILGKAQVLQMFVITEGKKKWNVAGCRCTEGNLKKSEMYRLKRGDRIIFEGKLASLRHLKNEVETIKNDVECGVRFEDRLVALQPGDTLICFRTYETKPETSWDPGF